MKIICKSKELETIRIKKGFSRGFLATEVGVRTLTISRIEKGEVSPTPKTAKKICDALNIEFDEIFIIK